MIALGIIGWPLELTLSPKLHEYLFKITSLKGTYDKLPIKTIEHSKLKALLDEYVGLNVTSPHKEAVYRELVSLSKASESVTAIGAVNTISVDNESLFLDNTDYKGFLLEISRLNFDPENKNILILGSGGSSKSIQYALKRLNPKGVYVASRNPNQEQLSYRDLNSIKDQVNMLINTTPLGMPPYNSESPLREDLKFKNLEFVIDIGYGKKESTLLKHHKGVEVVNGLGMLIAQGIESFNLWTKSKISFPDLYQEIRKFLEEEIYD